MCEFAKKLIYLVVSRLLEEKTILDFKDFDEQCIKINVYTLAIVSRAAFTIKAAYMNSVLYNLK
jgi:hypothetical protein